MYIVKEIFACRNYMSSFLQLTDSKPCTCPLFHKSLPLKGVCQAMCCQDSSSSVSCTVSSCCQPCPTRTCIHLTAWTSIFKSTSLGCRGLEGDPRGQSCCGLWSNSWEWDNSRAWEAENLTVITVATYQLNVMVIIK